MFNKNFKNLVLQDGTSDPSTSITAYTDLAGNSTSNFRALPTQLTGQWINGNIQKLWQNNGTGSILALGSGSSPTTINTYNFDNMLDNTLFTYLSHNIVNTLGSGTDLMGATLTITYTFRYDGSETATIREVGWLHKRHDYISQSFVPSQYILFAREVIEPITVNNGDTFTVSMAIG